MEHRPDDWVPRYLAGYFKLSITDIPLRLNGGNFLCNGEGWIFTTSQVKIYSDLLPDRRIVPIDATTLIEKNGSLHCISINLPEWGVNVNVE